MKPLPLDENIKEIEIYLIKSRISDEFFVWKAKKPNSYTAYKDHARLKYEQTKNLFSGSIKESQMPQMYLLDTVKTTDQTAYRYCLAWTRYFLEQGLKSLSGQTIINSANDLLEETEVIYNAIKDVPIEQILDKEHLIVGDYQKINQEKKRVPQDRITFRVTDKEYEAIQKNAKKLNLSMSRYCKNMVLKGHVITLDGPPLWEYTAEVREAKNNLQHILYAIYTNGEYFPADLECHGRYDIKRIEKVAYFGLNRTNRKLLQDFVWRICSGYAVLCSSKEHKNYSY